jgi:hypothetical protein
MDDKAIITAVKSRFVESRGVGASSTRVETCTDTVTRSGFAGNMQEKRGRRDPCR